MFSSVPSSGIGKIAFQLGTVIWLENDRKPQKSPQKVFHPVVICKTCCQIHLPVVVGWRMCSGGSWRRAGLLFCGSVMRRNLVIFNRDLAYRVVTVTYNLQNSITLPSSLSLRQMWQKPLNGFLGYCALKIWGHNYLDLWPPKCNQFILVS